MNTCGTETITSRRQHACLSSHQDFKITESNTVEKPDECIQTEEQSSEMSKPAQTEKTADEEVPLNAIDTVPGSGDGYNNDVIISTAEDGASCCDDRNYRKLAIWSIICGISCIGIMALINSVKAEETTDPDAAALFSKRAKKFGIMSIVIWVSILALTPILMALISYLLTLLD